MAKPSPQTVAMQPAEPELPAELCEVCGKPAPLIASLAFRRGKARRVCIWCLTEPVQALTGFKMLKMLDSMLERRAMAADISRTYRRAAAELLLEESARGQ